MSKAMIYIIIGLVVIGAAGALYYFVFMSEPAVNVSSSLRLESTVPDIDVSVMENSAFEELTNFTSLPIVVGETGNIRPFSEITFFEPIAAATTTLVTTQ